MKTLVLFFSLISFQLFAQCTIIGPKAIVIGSTQEYLLSGKTLDCSQCFHWNVVGNIKALSSITNRKKITVKAKKLGSGYLVASFKTKGKPLKCSLGIDIIEKNTTAPQPPQTSAKPDCSEKSFSILIKKVEKGIIALQATHISNQDYEIQWKVTYLDNTSETSQLNQPEFSVSPTRPITSIRAVLTQGGCTLIVTKGFSQGFWTFY